MRLYQPTLEAAHVQSTRNQIASVVANGCKVAGYFWPYHGSDVRGAAHDVIGLALACGLTMPWLGIDIETYTDGQMPTADEIRQILDECDACEVRPVIYSSLAMWLRIGSPQFSGRDVWIASYDGRPDLMVGSFGGMKVVGHQYADSFEGTNIDMNVFDRSLWG